jgi:hypothetical protein
LVPIAKKREEKNKKELPYIVQKKKRNKTTRSTAIDLSASYGAGGGDERIPHDTQLSSFLYVDDKR